MTAEMQAMLPQDLFREVDLASEEVRQNFRQYLSEWARHPPFYVRQNGAPQAVIARFADMQTVLNDRKRFSSVPPQLPGTPMKKFMPNKFMNVTPPTQIEGEGHARFRKLVNPAFSAASLARYTGLIETVIDGIIDRAVADGPEFDAMADFAGWLMPLVMLEGMFGFTPEERASFVHMNQCLRLTSKLSPEDPFPQEYVDAFAAAEAAIEGIVERRRAAPGDDIISSLVLASEDGDRLTDRELFELIFVFGAGAIESTAATTGGALLTLAQHPDQFARVKADTALIPAALNECMRYHGPGFLLFTRYAMVDTQLGGTPLPAGMPIYVCNQAASYDPVQFPDPLTFDIGRNPERVPVFGGGVHFCLGNRLAVMVMTRALTALFSRFPAIDLAQPDFQPVYDGALSETQLVALPMRAYPNTGE